MTSSESPDAAAAGFLESAPDPSRYDWVGIVGEADLCEAPGIVARWLPSGVSLLDIGCGSGAITERVNQGKNNRVMGVELDATRAAAARARGLNVITGLADETFFAEHGPFDVILFTDVLEHLPNPSQTLALAIGGLRPGGLIIASVPNVAHWTVRLRLLLGRFNYTEDGIMDATHLRWFTKKTFRVLFERAGLKVIQEAASAGTWMGEYRRLPFRLLPSRPRRKLVEFLSRRLPRLFGCQHIIKAQRL